MWGDILIVRPHSTGFVAAIICMIIVAIALYLYFGHYSLKVSGTGELIPKSGIAKIYSNKKGIVSTVFIKDGDHVKEGQNLFSIKSNRKNEDGIEFDHRLVQSIKDKIDILSKASTNERRRHRNALMQLSDETKRNEKLLAQIQEQIDTQFQIIKSFQTILSETEQLLQSGHIAKIEYNSRKERFLNHTQELAALRRQQIDLENKIDGYESKKSDLELNFQKKELDFEREILSLRERLLSLENDRLTYIPAPVSGQVSGLQAIAGNSVTGSIPMLSIVPVDQELYAHLYVPANSIGFVKRDQRVKLMFDAYDYRKFGAYDGVVTSITDTLFTPREVGPSITIKEPCYRVTIKLARQTVDAYGEQVKLRPNMRLKADIVLASRRLYEWLLDPFTRFRRAA